MQHQDHQKHRMKITWHPKPQQDQQHVQEGVYLSKHHNTASVRRGIRMRTNNMRGLWHKHVGAKHLSAALTQPYIIKLANLLEQCWSLWEYGGLKEIWFCKTSPSLNKAMNSLLYHKSVIVGGKSIGDVNPIWHQLEVPARAKQAYIRAFRTYSQ